MTYDYSIFGLRVRSDLELPELPPVEASKDPDVVISQGAVPRAENASGWLWSAQGETVMQIDGVARFAVREGAAICVDPHPGADQRDVRVYLLGSAMGLLLHQRGLLPLHANAIEARGGAAAFAGRSGTGKSTLAGWFHDQGVRVIADDVCVVDFDGSGSPVVTPGLQRLRLWRDALERSGRDPRSFALSFTADGSREKYDVPLPRGAANEPPVPLRAVYLLERGDAFRIEPVSGAAAIEILFANTYRGLFIDERNRVAHWQSCVSLARTVPIFRVDRVWGFADFEDQNERLLAHFADLAA